MSVNYMTIVRGRDLLAVILIECSWYYIKLKGIWDVRMKDQFWHENIINMKIVLRFISVSNSKKNSENFS